MPVSLLFRFGESPTNQEMLSSEKVVCYSQFSRGGGMPHQAGPNGEAPESVWGQREQGGKCGQQPLLCFL